MGSHESSARFPLWLLALPLVSWLAFAGWRATTGEPFLESLLWPGAAVLVAALAVSVLGWKLDID